MNPQGMETAPMATHDFVPQFLGSLLSKADAPAATKAVATKAVVKEAAPAPRRVFPSAAAAPESWYQDCQGPCAWSKPS